MICIAAKVYCVHEHTLSHSVLSSYFSFSQLKGFVIAVTACFIHFIINVDECVEKNETKHKKRRSSWNNKPTLV